MSRRLDAAIAKGLGYEVIIEQRMYSMSPFLYHIKMNNGRFRDLPEYFMDGNAMIELDWEMVALGWRLIVWVDDYGFHALYYESTYKSVDEIISYVMYSGTEYVAKATTMSLAVALAAYYSLTGKEWKEE